MNVKQEKKIAELKRLVKIWVAYFSKQYTHSDVMVGKKYITVKLWNPKTKEIFDDLEFTFELLGKTVVTYRSKIGKAFKNRHKKS